MISSVQQKGLQTIGQTNAIIFNEFFGLILSCFLFYPHSSTHICAIVLLDHSTFGFRERPMEAITDEGWLLFTILSVRLGLAVALEARAKALERRERAERGQGIQC